MFFQGSNLLDAQAAMELVSIEAIYHRLRDDGALRDETERLRKVKQLDVGAYTRLKTRLPFVCCGQFRNGIRRSEHFETIQTWILDVDHYSGNMTDLVALREQLKADERIALLFVSPGGDGLKLFFKLTHPCTDTKRFSEAYKTFAFAFGEQYNLTRFIDFRTADVTRVCFLAHDPHAYINIMGDDIDWEALLPEQTQLALKQVLEPVQAEGEKSGRSHAIHPEVYSDIMRKLKAKAKPNPLHKPVFVPEVLTIALPVIIASLAEEGMELKAQRDIQYGIQLEIQCKNDRADVNLFYGKKGFSIVLVERKNTNLHLGQLVIFMIEQALYSRHSWYESMDGTLPTGDADAPASALGDGKTTE